MKRVVQQLVYCLIVVGMMVTIVHPQQPKPTLPVTDDDFQSLLVAVSNEEWEKTVALASQYLKQMKSDDERLPRLRYIYLYGAAGKTSEGRMEFEELTKLLRDFVGKDIAVPYRPITTDCGRTFNFICPSKEAKDKFMVAASNKTATTILAFEYVTLKEAFEFFKSRRRDSIGRRCRAGNHTKSKQEPCNCHADLHRRCCSTVARTKVEALNCARATDLHTSE